MTLLETLQVDPRDRKLLAAFLAVGLAVMTLGGLFALLMKLVRTPALEMLSTGVYYQWNAWLNLSLGIGAMLATVVGAVFVLVIGMTALAGERVATMEAAVADLMPTGLPEPTGNAWTPVALLPATAFIVGIVLLTVLAFSRLAGMAVQLH
jgi:hypothetical protein